MEFLGKPNDSTSDILQGKVFPVEVRSLVDSLCKHSDESCEGSCGVDRGKHENTFHKPFLFQLMHHIGRFVNFLYKNGFSHCDFKSALFKHINVIYNFFKFRSKNDILVLC